MYCRENAWTIPELKDRVQESLAEECRAMILGTVFDIRAWLDPCINLLAGITVAHHFW